jgi:hypothetical protein
MLVVVECKPENPLPGDCWNSNHKFRVISYSGHNSVYSMYSDDAYSCLLFGQAYAKEWKAKYENRLWGPEFPDFIG